MAEVTQSTSLTKQCATNMSRHELLQWINTLVQGNYKKVEELSSGVAYLQILSKIYPNSIEAHEIKFPATLEKEKLLNLKLLQTTLAGHNIDKKVPIQGLLKADFQVNFEFLKWFNTFHESHLATKKETPKEAGIKKEKPIAYVTPTLKSDTSAEDMEARFERIIQRQQNLQVHCETINNILYEMEKDLKEQMERGENVEFCERILEAMNADDLTESDLDLDLDSDSDDE